MCPTAHHTVPSHTLDRAYLFVRHLIEGFGFPSLSGNELLCVDRHPNSPVIKGNPRLVQPAGESCRMRVVWCGSLRAASQIKELPCGLSQLPN